MCQQSKADKALIMGQRPDVVPGTENMMAYGHLLLQYSELRKHLYLCHYVGHLHMMGGTCCLYFVIAICKSPLRANSGTL